MKKISLSSAVTVFLAFVAGIAAGVATMSWRGDSSAQVATSLERVILLIVAVLTAFIAYRQAKSDETKLRLSLYDQRQDLLRTLRAVRRAAVSTDSIEPQLLAELGRRAADVPFLFDASIGSFVEEVLQNGNRLFAVASAIQSYTAAGQSVDKTMTDERAHYRRWLERELGDSMSSRFKPFMQLEQ